jgi:hypothetical protein
MTAGPRKRVHRTRPTGRLARRAAACRLTRPSQDPAGKAQARARLRALTSIRAAGGLIVFAAMAVLGVVGLATGHEHSGLIALAFGGGAVIVIVGSLNRRRG